MIEQNVQVVQFDESHVWVRLGGTPGCAVCDRGKGCGAGVFAKLLSRKPVTLKLGRDDQEIMRGQLVSLLIPDHIYMKLVLSHYGWPLLAALIGAWSGYQVGLRMNIGPIELDVMTFIGAVFAGGVTMRTLNNGLKASSVTGSLKLAVTPSSLSVQKCGNAIKGLD